MQQVRQFRKNEQGVTAAVNQIAVGGILVFIAFVIVLAVYPSVADATASAQSSANVTGASDTLLGLLPLVLAAGLIISGLIFLVSGVRGLGKA